ncbi:hypothetical protein ACHAPT_006389 [Fusarium lateritium]
MAEPGSYIEFPPFGVTGPRFALADAMVDPVKTESRRPYVRAFLLHMVPDANEEKLDKYWKQAPENSDVARAAGLEANAVPIWPWEEACLATATSQTTQVWERYVEEAALPPVQPPFWGVVPQVNALALTKAMEETQLDIDQRQKPRDATWGNSGIVGDIVGPFEIELPSYFPMAQYFGAEDPEAIRQLLPIGLAIRLDFDSRRLSLGFSCLGGPGSVRVRLGLLSVWVHVRGWLHRIYRGQPSHVIGNLVLGSLCQGRGAVLDNGPNLGARLLDLGLLGLGGGGCLGGTGRAGLPDGSPVLRGRPLGPAMRPMTEPSEPPGALSHHPWLGLKRDGGNLGFVDPTCGLGGIQVLTDLMTVASAGGSGCKGIGCCNDIVVGLVAVVDWTGHHLTQRSRHGLGLHAVRRESSARRNTTWLDWGQGLGARGVSPCR